MQSLLDQVNILIKMKVGDAYRLEHIKLMLKQKRTVYGSDRVYLDHLIDEYVEQIKIQKQHREKAEETMKSAVKEKDEAVNKAKNAIADKLKLQQLADSRVILKIIII